MECLRRAPDRQLFLFSRALMRTVLADQLDCKAQDLRFSANGFGKPILQVEPSVHFNLTHSHGAVALAVSKDREVGIDIEDRQRKVEYLALAERYFAAAEARHLQQVSDLNLRDAFFAIWTLKEAYVKAIGRGLSFPLDAFAFELEIDRLKCFHPLADFVMPDWHFHQFDLGERHRGALAVQASAGDAIQVQFHDWAMTFQSGVA
jgi:4'-phosphopantetheinyl transferase